MSNINITPFYSRGYEQQTISSREVAEMMEIKEHSKMIRKIEQINEVLNEAKIGLVVVAYEKYALEYQMPF